MKRKKNIKPPVNTRKKKQPVKWGYLLFFFIAVVLFAAFVAVGILLGEYIDSLHASGELFIISSII